MISIDAFEDSLGDGLMDAVDSVEIIFGHWTRLRSLENENWKNLTWAVCSAVDRSMRWWDYDEFPPYDEPLTEIEILFADTAGDLVIPRRAHRPETVASIAFYREPHLTAGYSHRTYELDLTGCRTFDDLGQRLRLCGLLQDIGKSPTDVDSALNEAILERLTDTHVTVEWTGRLCDGHPDFPDQAQIESSLAFRLSEIMRAAEEQAVDGKRSPVLEVNIEAPVFNLPSDVLARP
ncbi:hypothetical protein [Gordonia sp. C13]|uniref:hypothetical protein n=1 Tax=Gordonia sp. C13 TaxID=2935078 RepID=UPI00200AD1E1|nr:hypothetical protein [Gordonia sp. C13]MCK8616111.1 hypothetical protein [Gordonia sp. C13]